MAIGHRDRGELLGEFWCEVEELDTDLFREETVSADPDGTAGDGDFPAQAEQCGREDALGCLAGDEPHAMGGEIQDVAVRAGDSFLFKSAGFAPSVIDSAHMCIT